MTREELDDVILKQWEAHRLGRPTRLERAAAMNVAISYALATGAEEVRYEREPVPGGELERWDAVQSWDAPAPRSVPSDARREYGYKDAAGRPHVVWARYVRPCGDDTPVVAFHVSDLIEAANSLDEAGLDRVVAVEALRLALLEGRWLRPDDIRAAAHARRFVLIGDDEDVGELAGRLGAEQRLELDEATGEPRWEWRIVEGA